MDQEAGQGVDLFYIYEKQKQKSNMNIYKRRFFITLSWWAGLAS
jgi:hypothetical protein